MPAGGGTFNIGHVTTVRYYPLLDENVHTLDLELIGLYLNWADFYEPKEYILALIEGLLDSIGTVVEISAKE